MIQKPTPEISASAFEPNTTQVPNFIFEMIPHLSEAELKLLMVIIRKTYGWHKGSDKISAGQLESLTGLSYSAIKKARASLQKKGVSLIKFKGNGRAITEYCRPYPVHAEEPVDAGGSPWGPPGGPGEVPQGGHKEALTKDTSYKRHLEQKQTEIAFLSEYQKHYFKAFKQLPKTSRKEIAHVQEIIKDYSLTDSQLSGYLETWGQKWREDPKFWPASLLKFDGALIARLDKEKSVQVAEDEEILAEVRRFFPDYKKAAP